MLKTNYLGLDLNSPVVVGACDLVEDPKNLVKLQKAGAGAIVYKSLFEEQIQLEDLALFNHLHAYDERNAEMTRLFPEIDYTGPREFIMRLKKAREQVTIPLIASLNAVYGETWVKYAKELESTGVDALELNFFNVPFSLLKSGQDIEAEQIQIVKEVVAAVKIPVSVKLSPYYTNTLEFIKRLDQTGIKGVVLFNKLFQPDIDIEVGKHITPWNISHQREYRLSLRFAGLLFNQINSQVIASKGIFTGDDAVRLLLAGAQAVQVVSTIYKNGVDQVTRINHQIEEWMKSRSHTSIDQFRGKLSKANTPNPFVYKRAQYIDMVLKSEELIGRPVM